MKKRNERRKEKEKEEQEKMKNVALGSKKMCSYIYLKAI
jgi:hypothetical protein